MKLAGIAASRYCLKPEPPTWAFLAFGDDEGVVSDASFTLRRALSEGRQNTETIILDQDQIKRDPAQLFDALEARSLLGEDRIIRVSTTGDRIAALLLEALTLGEAQPDRFEARLVITAGALAKRAKLRTGFEAAKNAIALHFYSDDTSAISDHTLNTLKPHQIEIEQAALALFVSELPGHRGLANQEIEKLTLYGANLGRAISTSDVRMLSTTDSDHNILDLVAATLNGNISAAQAELDKLTVAGTSSISILRSLQRNVVRLIEAHSLSGRGSDIGKKLRPPVYPNDWPAFRDRMALWPPKRLSRILERIYEAEAMIKEYGHTGDAIVLKLISELAVTAARSR